MNKRLDYLDVAKGIGIILVVYGHACAQMRATAFYGDYYLTFQDVIIFSIVMPLFFIISGVFNKEKLCSSLFSHKQYLKKISFSLLIPFYSLSILFMVINLLFNKYVKKPTLGEMIYSILVQQTHSEKMPSGVLWFLFILFIFSISSYFFIKFLKLSPLHIFLLSVFLKYLHGLYLHKYNFFGVDQATNFFVYYSFGLVAATFITQRPFYRWRHLMVILFLYLTSIVITTGKLSSSIFLYALSQVLTVSGATGILGTILVVGLSFNISKFKSQNIKKILSYCGTYSILIYVFHMPTFTVIKIFFETVNLRVEYLRLMGLFIPGVLLPLLYGKILSLNRSSYRILIGRNP